MRLPVLDNGHRLRARLFFGLTKLMSKVDMSDVPKTLLYRPSFFGRAMLEHSAQTMRGKSFWTAGEREYIAMTTAQWHHSPYCATSHTEMVRIASTGEIDATDPTSTRPELRAILVLLEKVSRTPGQLTPSDIHPVRTAGVPDHAITEALHVNLIWNIVNRLANALNFQLRPGQLEKGTRALHRYGYRFPSFLTREGKPPTTDPLTELRHLAANAAPLPEPLLSYATIVREASHRLTDADIHRLTTAGHTEDEIFETTVTAAVTAALTSLDAGLHALHTATQTSH